MPYLSLLICIDFKSVIAARTASATYETICKGAPQRKNCTAGVFWSKVGISFFSIIIVIEEEEQQGHYLDRRGRPSTIHLRSMTRRGNIFSVQSVQKKPPIKQKTKMAKHGRLVNISRWCKGVQRGPKGSEMVNIDIFDNLRISSGPIWTLLDHFRQKSICCPIKVWQKCF